MIKNFTTTIALLLTTSTAFAGFLGNTPKRFASDKLELSLTPTPPHIADGGPAYYSTIDGFEVKISNEVLSNKLMSLSEQLSRYSESKDCAFDPVSLGNFSTSGTLTKSKGMDPIAGSVKYLSADLSNADSIAKSLKLPANWKSRCK
jgi:hypothetical protein